MFLSLFRTMKLVVRIAATDIWGLVFINLIVGAGPVIVLYLSKVVIDETVVIASESSGVGGINTISSSNILLWSVVFFILINIVLDTAETINGFQLAKLKDKLVGGIKRLIFKKVAEFENISLFEDPKLLNNLHLAYGNIQKITQLLNVIINLLTGVFTFIPVFILSFLIAWWVPIIIFITAIPSILKQLQYEEKTWSVESAQADLVKQMNINESVLTNEVFSKELRQYQLSSFFLDRWNKLFDKAFKQLQDVRKRGTYVVLFWSLLSGVGVGIPYIYVVYMAGNGAFSLGDLALFAGLVYQVRRSIFILVGNLTEVQGIALASTALFDLLNLKQNLKIGNMSMDEVTNNESTFLSFQSVSFSYPGNNRLVLDDINLNINKGELVVIVGDNGSGKTTLAKLITRMYDPTEGEINFNGVDIKEFNITEYRKRIAVVNQDFSKFPNTARENIGFGYLSKLNEDPDIYKAAEGAGLSEMLKNLEAGIDTPLTKQLENGIDLSGGQWQRISIARALMRREQSDIILLDEPTASLDPNTEHDIFNILKEMSKEKIAIVISHRLALATMADHIVVMKKGRIIEFGDHQELMERQGDYHSLFTKQSSSYLVKK